MVSTSMFPVCHQPANKLPDQNTCSYPVVYGCLPSCLCTHVLAMQRRLTLHACNLSYDKLPLSLTCKPSKSLEYDVHLCQLGRARTQRSCGSSDSASSITFASMQLAVLYIPLALCLLRGTRGRGNCDAQYSQAQSNTSYTASKYASMMTVCDYCTVATRSALCQTLPHWLP